MSKKYTTNFLEDTNGSTGSANQVLVSTAAGVDWVDGSGSGIIGGPYLPLAGGTMTGALVNKRINMNRSAGAGGQLWYSSSYTSWQNYMNPGGAGAGYSATITAPTGTYVTSWALRSFIENASGYGWTWEGGSSSTTTPSIVAELSSSSGNFKTIGNIYASGGNSTEWNTAYDNSITALAFSGTSTTTLTLTQQDGGTIINTFSNPQGTVTGATSGNVNTITVSSSSTSPVVTPVTGAVNISSAKLATGSQIQTAINTALLGVLSYQSTWNASTNSPALASGVGTPGYYYIVSVAGSTNLDGITDWAVGDWAVFSDLATDAWQKIDNTQVGNVTGDGTAGRVAYWNSNTNITNDGDLTFDGANLTVGGNLTVTGNQYFNGEFIEGDGKEMFRYNDAWLRINEDNDFSSGIYCGTGVLRTDGAFQVGSGGASALITSTGLATFAGTITAPGGNSTEWNTAYDNSVTAINDSGTSTTTITLTQQDGGTLSTAFSNPQGTVTSVSGTGSVSGLTLTGTVTSSGNITLGGAISGFTPLNDIRSLGTVAFTNGANPNITTAQVMAEIESDGGFDSYSSVFKTSWSYAGNYNLTDAGDFTETAGSSWITWTDNSSDTTRGNITTLAIAPNTGGSAGGVFIYNDQGASYAPGWRQVWTSTTDGSGSGLDADLLDGQQGSYYFQTNITGNAGTVTNGVYTVGTQTIGGAKTFSDHVTISGDSKNLYIFNTAETQSGITFGDTQGGAAQRAAIKFDSSSETLDFFVNDETAERMSIDTAGALTINNGQIVLNGTGRIQGIDTVSASTDAANKAYVDAQSHANYYTTTATFNTTNGIISFSGAGGQPAYSVDIDGRFLPLSGGTMSGTLTMNGQTISMGNGSIINLNSLTFNDPGADEGVAWNGGNLWKIYESPNTQTNAAGNLQFVQNTTRRLTIDTSGNVEIVGGDLTVGGGDITLSGTGRIQGVDTVSASTDAANKAYVDAHPAGTVTGTGVSAKVAVWTNTTNIIDGPITFSSNDAIFAGNIAVQGGGDSYFTGDVGIGITSPLHRLSIESAAATLLKIRNTTNGGGAAMEFNDNGSSASTQNGKITYYHSDGSSQGGGSSYWLTGEDDQTLVLANNGRVVVQKTGSSTEVGYGFYDDINTGMYRIGSDNLGFATGGVNRLNITNALATFSGDLTVNGGDIILGGVGRVQGIDTVSASTDAVNKAYVDDNAAPYVTFTRTGINSSTYTMIATVNGDLLASIIKMTMTGTSGSVVFACTFDITVNHSQDIHVKSMNGDYTEVTLRITSNNNEDYSIEAKHNGGSTTTAEVCIFPLANEAITPTTTDPGYTGAEYEHTATEGWRFGGEDNSVESSNVIVDGKIGIGTTSPSQKLDVNGNIAVSGTTFVDSTRRNIYLDSFAGGDGNGIFFRTGYTYNASITVEDHNGSSADGICISGSDGVSFSTGANTKNERMRIDSSGNVGIGTTSPTSALGSTKVLDISSTGNGEVILDHTDAGTASDLGLYSWARNNDHLAHIKATCDGSTTAAFISFHAQPSGGSFSNAGSNEKMRIKSNGYVGIGTTSPSRKLEVDGKIATSAGNGFEIITAYGSNRLSDYYTAFTTNTSTLYVGTPFTGKACYASAFNITSDYRLKDNVIPLIDAIDRIKKLQPIRFNYKNKENTVDGFIAHEVFEVIPEAVTGEKDEVWDDGLEKFQGLDQAKIVPLLTAALQQAIDKIEALEQRIQLIENK